MFNLLWGEDALLMVGNYTFFFPRKFTNLTSFSLGRQQSLCVWLNGWFASEQACRNIVWNQKEVKGGSLITELEVPLETSKVPHSFLRESGHLVPGTLGNIE